MSTPSDKHKRGIGGSSLTSLASFMIPKPILKSKGRTLRLQTFLFALEVIFCISAILGDWLVISLPVHGSSEHFSMTSSFASPSNDPNKPNDYVQLYIVPLTAQMCANAAAGLSVIGFLASIAVTYSSKIPDFYIKFILGNNILIALAIFFLGIASQAGFESNMSQISTIITLTGSLKGVDASGRGYGYASLILSWIVAIPLVVISNTVFFGHLRGAWENDWRETLRASWGQGAPDWLQQVSSTPPSPSNTQTELKMSPYQNKVPINIKA